MAIKLDTKVGTRVLVWDITVSERPGSNAGQIMPRGDWRMDDDEFRVQLDDGSDWVFTAEQLDVEVATYYTVVVHVVPESLRTRWHGDAELTRGAFGDFSEAVQWARTNLCGLPYSVREVTP